MKYAIANISFDTAESGTSKVSVIGAGGISLPLSLPRRGWTARVCCAQVAVRIGVRSTDVISGDLQ